MNDELAGQLAALHADAFGWSLHCCAGDRSRAEEVLQIAYLKAADGRARPGGLSSLKTWWFGVIRFTAREEWRRHRFRQTLLGRLWQQALGEGSSDPAPSPIRRMEYGERAQALRRCLALLPARQAEVLHLVFYQDLTLSQAAGIMGVSVGAVRQHYERGKARLRLLLKENEPPELQPETSHDALA